MGRKAVKIPNTEKDIKFVRELVAHGVTNRKLAEMFGIGLTTLEKWLRGESKFARAIREGRMESCQKVIDSVFRRACGYEYTEEVEKLEVVRNEKDEIITDSNGKPTVVLRTISRIHKHQPADIPAAKFYLWNRTKTWPPEKQWNNKQNIDLSSVEGSMTPRERITMDMDPMRAMAIYQQLIRDTKK